MRMSDVYVGLLERVHQEFDAAHDALVYVEQNWYRKNVFLDIPGSSLPDMGRAAKHQEAVYFIQLFSTFEAILKEHLAQHHPQITVPEEARAVWLIDRVAQRQTLPITAALRSRMHDVCRYRNYLTHLNDRPPSPIPFTTALARLNKFVDHLPEPR